jgi:hypothetical protein
MSMNKDPALLKGENLMRAGVYDAFTLTIKTAENTTRKVESGETKTGLLLHFEKASLPLFAPKDQLNYRLIRAELGSVEPSELVGRELTLIPTVGDWFSERNILAIRVMVTGDKPKPKVSKKSFGTSIVGRRVRPEAAK